MENNIYKFVLRYIAPNAIFAVLYLLMSSCSAKQKLVEQGSRVEAESINNKTFGDVFQSYERRDSTTVSDSIQTQISARVEVHQEDSITTVRVTDYDAATGRPVRTTETESRLVMTDTSVNADYLKTMLRYTEQIEAMQSLYDSLVVSMTDRMNIARQDSTRLCQTSRHSFSSAKLTGLGLLFVIFAMLCIAIRFYFRR